MALMHGQKHIFGQETVEEVSEEDYREPTDFVEYKFLRERGEYNSDGELVTAGYPSIQEQLDMLYHAIDSNTLDKTSDFYTTLKAVKDAFPKPTE